MADAEFRGGIRIYFHKWNGTEFVVVADLAGAGAGVEVLHQAARVQPEWKLIIWPFVVIDKRQGN